MKLRLFESSEITCECSREEADVKFDDSLSHEEIFTLAQTMRIEVIEGLGCNELPTPFFVLDSSTPAITCLKKFFGSVPFKVIGRIVGSCQARVEESSFSTFRFYLKAMIMKHRLGVEADARQHHLKLSDTLLFLKDYFETIVSKNYWPRTWPKRVSSMYDELVLRNVSPQRSLLVARCTIALSREALTMFNCLDDDQIVPDCTFKLGWAKAKLPVSEQCEILAYYYLGIRTTATQLQDLFNAYKSKDTAKIATHKQFLIAHGLEPVVPAAAAEAAAGAAAAGEGAAEAESPAGAAAEAAAQAAAEEAAAQAAAEAAVSTSLSVSLAVSFFVSSRPHPQSSLSSFTWLSLRC